MTIQRDLAKTRARRAKLQRQLEDLRGGVETNEMAEQVAHASKKRRVESPEQRGTEAEAGDLLRWTKLLVNKRIKLTVWKEELQKDLQKVHESLSGLHLVSGPSEFKPVADRFDQTSELGQLLEIVDCVRGVGSLVYRVRFATPHALGRDCLWRSAEWVNKHAPELVFEFHASFPHKPRPRVLIHNGVSFRGI